MRQYKGTAVVKGIAVGKICIYKRKEKQIERIVIEDAGAELLKLEEAKEEAAVQLQALYEKTLKEAGPESAAIFEMHSMILEDGAYNDIIVEMIENEMVCAEYAVKAAGRKFEEMFASMDDEMNIVFKIKSACPAVREMAKDVKPIPLFEAIAMPFTENAIYKKCNALQHVACPVPCGMVKAAEAAGEMALKKPVSFQWE